MFKLMSKKIITIIHNCFCLVGPMKVYYKGTVLLMYILSEGEDASEDELEDDELEDEEDSHVSTARPRRMSEIRISNKVKPIPNASTLFILSPTNK